MWPESIKWVGAGVKFVIIGSWKRGSEFNFSSGQASAVHQRQRRLKRGPRPRQLAHLHRPVSSWAQRRPWGPRGSLRCVFGGELFFLQIEFACQACDIIIIWKRHWGHRNMSLKLFSVDSVVCWIYFIDTSQLYITMCFSCCYAMSCSLDFQVTWQG